MISERCCIDFINELIVRADLTVPRLTSLRHLTSNVFVQLLRVVLRSTSITNEPREGKNEREKYRAILAIIEEKLLFVPLEHLDVGKLVNKDVKSLYNLAEIISACLGGNRRKRNSNSQTVPKQFWSNRIEQFQLLFEGFSSSSSSTPIQMQHISNISVSSSSIDTYPEKKSEITNEIHRKTISTQTEQESNQEENFPVKDDKTADNLETSFSVLKSKWSENFSLEIGLRVHEALKLRQKTQEIENRITELNATRTIEKRVCNSKVKSPLRKSTPSKGKIVIPKTRSLVKTNQCHIFTVKNFLDDLLKVYPNASRELVKKLKIQEKQQQKLIENVNEDIKTNQMKSKRVLRNAINRQEKRTEIMNKQLNQLTQMTALKQRKAADARQKADQRDARTETAKMVNFVNDFQRESISRHKRAESLEDLRLKKCLEEKLKRQKEDLLEFKKRTQDQQRNETRKQGQLLDSIETLYQNHFDMMKEALAKEEEELKETLRSRTKEFSGLKRQLQYQLDKEMSKYRSPLL